MFKHVDGAAGCAVMVVIGTEQSVDVIATVFFFSFFFLRNYDAPAVAVSACRVPETGGATCWQMDW